MLRAPLTRGLPKCPLTLPRPAGIAVERKIHDARGGVIARVNAWEDVAKLLAATWTVKAKVPPAAA